MANLEIITIGYKKSNKGDVVTIRLQPDEEPGQLRDAPLGTRFAAAFVVIADDETTPPWDEDGETQ